MRLILSRLKEIVGDEERARAALKLICDHLRDYDTGIGGEELEMVREDFLDELGIQLVDHDRAGGFEHDPDNDGPICGCEPDEGNLFCLKCFKCFECCKKHDEEEGALAA